MSAKRASCSCGKLSVICEGEPTRISICCCTACQKRTGAAYGVSAFFRSEQVEPSGMLRTYERRSDADRWLRFHFCGECGSTVYWTAEFRPGIIGVAAGMFADQSFIKPQLAVWTERKMPWTPLPDDIPAYEGQH